MIDQGLNIIAILKGREKYTFIYTDDQAAAAINTLGRFASTPDLSFTWYDAAILAQRIRAGMAASKGDEFLPNNRLK